MTFIIDIFQFDCKSKHKKVSEIKLNGAYANLTVAFLINKVVHHLMTFEIYFLIRFISKMNNSADGKISFV